MTREKVQFFNFEQKNVKNRKSSIEKLQAEKKLRKKVFEIAHHVLREYGIELSEEELLSFLLLMDWVRFQNLKRKLSLA